MPPTRRRLDNKTGSVDQRVVLPDGRSLGYRVFGDPNGWPVIALHGTPGSRFKYSGSHDAAAAMGLRLISVDRWGYGLSSLRRHGTLADFGDDIGELADRLGLDQFQVTGVSGGGPFAVAVAARLGPRVTALALVSPVGILCGPAGQTWLAPFHTVCFRVLPRVPGVIPAAFHLFRGALAVAPESTMALVLSRAPEIDRRAIAHPETLRRLTDAFRSGLSAGVSGAGADMGLFRKPWNLDLNAITAPARIWIGLEDRNVPLAAVAVLLEALPTCDRVQLPGEGHLWVAQNSHVVMKWLADRLLPAHQVD